MQENLDMRSVTIFSLGIGTGGGIVLGITLGAFANPDLSVEGLGSIGDWTGALTACLAAVLAWRSTWRAEMRELKSERQLAKTTAMRIAPDLVALRSLLDSVKFSITSNGNIEQATMLVASLPFGQKTSDGVRLELLGDELGFKCQEVASLVETYKTLARATLAASEASRAALDGIARSAPDSDAVLRNFCRSAISAISPKADEVFRLLDDLLNHQKK